MLSIFVHPHWIPKPTQWKKALSQIERLRTALEISQCVRLALKPEDVIQNVKNNILSIVLEIEGLHSLGGKIERINELFNHGVRIFTLTWNNPNEFAGSSVETPEQGLTMLGRKALKLLMELGAIIDFSHVSEKALFEAIEMGVKPILSHSCARTLKNNVRNISDEALLAIGKAEGLVGVNFYPGFISSKSWCDVTLDDLIEHIEYTADVSGESCVALGSDFDGVRCLPREIKSASDFFKIPQRLLERGHSENLTKKICGTNFINFWRRIKNVA